MLILYRMHAACEIMVKECLYVWCMLFLLAPMIGVSSSCLEAHRALTWRRSSHSVSQPCYMRRVAKLSPIFVHFALAHDLSVHPRLFILQIHSAKQKVWTELTHRSCNSSEYAFKWYQVTNSSIWSDTLPNLPSLLALGSMYIADLQSLETVSTNIQSSSMVV